jgi:hypothetical protein
MAAPPKMKSSTDKDGKKSYQKLDEEAPPSRNSRAGERPPILANGTRPAKERTKEGGFFSDGTAMADGEYVWMPYAEARRHRSRFHDKDTCLWWLLLIFLGYFVVKMLPVILTEQGVIGDDAGDAGRRLVASLQHGDTITPELLQQLKLMASRRI